jgi:hypothetical protein
MVIPHYPYLLHKMPGPNGVLSIKGDLKHAFDYDVQVVQIAAKAQAASGREEIATVAAEINPQKLEVLAKKPSILAPPKEADVKQINMGTSDPSKTATISAHLSANRNLRSLTFLGTVKISLLGDQPTCQVSQESWLST